MLKLLDNKYLLGLEEFVTSFQGKFMHFDVKANTHCQNVRSSSWKNSYEFVNRNSLQGLSARSSLSLFPASFKRAAAVATYISVENL